MSMGFSIIGHEEEVLNFLRKFKGRRDAVSPRRVSMTKKFDRELRKLEWNIKEREEIRRSGAT